MAEPVKTTTTLAPHLVCDGAADAIDFYKNAFGAEEVMRLAGPNARLMHGAVSINGSMVMLVDENRDWGLLSPKALGGTPVTLTLNVPDVDAAVERAVAAGARITMPVADQFWGDRYGIVQDPFGHNWAMATPLGAPMSETELREAAAGAMCGSQEATLEHA